MTKTQTVEAQEIDFTPPPLANGLVVAEPAQVPVTPQPVSMLDIIDRASRDPSVDINKLERLIGMKDRMEARQAQVEFDNAMSSAQEEMQPIRANMENPQTKSEYADQAALDRAIRPIYTRHGFSLSYRSGDGAPAGEVRIVCVVAHRSGHREYPHLDMPADGKGARGGDVMTKTHATGAAATYGKRYLLGMIFNLAVARDDDGNGASMAEESDVEALAPKNAPRDANGKLLSTYSAGRANQARDWADQDIQCINLAANPEAVKDWYRENATPQPGKRKSHLDWLRDNSPGQYHRVKLAYENATGEEME